MQKKKIIIILCFLDVLLTVPGDVGNYYRTNQQKNEECSHQNSTNYSSTSSCIL